jgi:hypothetical protein
MYKVTMLEYGYLKLKLFLKQTPFKLVPYYHVTIVRDVNFDKLQCNPCRSFSHSFALALTSLAKMPKRGGGGQ